MHILSRLRRRSSPRQPQAQQTQVCAAPAATYRFAAEIPGFQGRPACRVDLQMLVEPHHDGQRLRLRTHLQANLASALRPALEAAFGARAAEQQSQATRQGLTRRAAYRLLGSGGQLRRFAEPLLRHDLNSWVDVHASSASLDTGAAALLPAPEQLAKLGIRPTPASAPAFAENWEGQSGNSYLQVSILQINRNAVLFSPWPRRMPLQVAAAIVSTLDEK